MATKTLARFKGKVRDEYLELVQTFPLTSIRSDQQLEEAQEVMDGLLAKRKLSHAETMYLHALSDLVATYEDEQYPFEPASDGDVLRHLMVVGRTAFLNLPRRGRAHPCSRTTHRTGVRPFL